MNQNESIDPAVYRGCIEEFRRRPIGRHSPLLHHLLLIMRADRHNGRYALVCLEPFKTWALARFPSERDAPLEIEPTRFGSLEAAEWEVFRRRWRRLTGEDLPA